MRALAATRHMRAALVALGASMRVRLTLWYLAILALVFLVFSGVLVGEVRQNEQAAQHAYLEKITQQMASDYDPADGLIHVDEQPPATFSKTKSQAVVAAGFILPAQCVALFVNPQGGVTQAMGSLSSDDIARLQAYLIHGGSATARVVNLAQAGGLYGSISLPLGSSLGPVKTQDYLTYTADVTSRGQLVGTLVVAMPDPLNQTAQSVIPALLLAGPITLLVAALGGYWLASRALRPVRLITRAAQQISETDLSRRLRLTSRDELGQLAATFDHMLGRLEAAFQRQRQFTSDASHELRTPLTIVNLEVTRALAAPRAPEEYVRTLVAIQSENLMMSRLVDDLLTLARADAERSPLRLAPVDLSDVALEAVERLAPLAQQCGVRLLVGDLPEVSVIGDRVILARALTNLVENGVKYTAGVGSQVAVTIRRVSADGRAWAVARVTDDGPGIAPEHLPHIFDRFYRVDASRAAETSPERDPAHDSSPEALSEATSGSGLGLAIAQWAAQAHGGEARVTSAPGTGATFEIWLPATLSLADEASVPYCESAE